MLLGRSRCLRSCVSTLGLMGRVHFFKINTQYDIFSFTQQIKILWLFMILHESRQLEICCLNNSRFALIDPSLLYCPYLCIQLAVILAIYNRLMSRDTKFQITDEQVWYIHVNNQTKGPVSLRDLDVLLRTNEINSRTLAWKVGMKQWRSLNDVEQIKQSILESSKEILEIQKKRESLFEKNLQKKEQNGPEGQDANNQIIQNKDENPLTILQTTVENLLKKTFYQSTDGKWNIYDEEKGEWVQQDEEPTEKIEMMKQLLFNKLKNQLFFEDKMNKRKKPQPHKEEKKEPEVPLTEEEMLKKEKNKKKAKRQAEKKKQKWYQAKINTFVYVSGLPFDVTEEELKQFMIKAGVLRIDLNTGRQKLKLYRDQSGVPKGDAAISYAKEQSVQLALQNLNNSEIRSGFKVKIEKAQFNQKEDQYKKRETKKQTLAKKIQSKMLEKKLLSWDEDIEEQGLGLKIVIMKHVIDHKQIDNDDYLQSVKKEITDEVTKIGEIQRIRFYQSHPDGVVEVKFKHEKDAQTCVSEMNGRFYDGRELDCDFWDGQIDYKRDASSLQLQQQRLQKFANEIEGSTQKGELQKIQEQGQQQDEQLINQHLLQQN